MAAHRADDFERKGNMQRLSIVLLISATLVASGCASRKYVRNEVKTTGDALSTRIDANVAETKEVRDGVDRVSQNVDRVGQRVTGVEGRVSTLDSGLNSLKGDVQNVDQKASTADQKAVTAQSAANRTAGDLVILDQRFQNRNQFTVLEEKSLPFKFDSSKLDNHQEILDGLVSSLTQNPNAILVLEGRTDSSGDRDYNMRLGERRVQAVKNYLVIDKSIPIYKIFEISLGAAKPIAENKTRDGREKNRAVTMTILVPKTESVASRNNNNETVPLDTKSGTVSNFRHPFRKLLTVPDFVSEVHT
jgi:outer membrane protein OmpA-like peptidoglycan-associated protein